MFFISTSYHHLEQTACGPPAISPGWEHLGHSFINQRTFSWVGEFKRAGCGVHGWKVVPTSCQSGISYLDEITFQFFKSIGSSCNKQQPSTFYLFNWYNLKDTIVSYGATIFYQFMEQGAFVSLVVMQRTIIKTGIYVYNLL